MADTLEAALSTPGNEVLIIDNDLRTVTIPEGMVLGVYNDDDTHRIKFKMPKTYGDIDLSTFKIRVNYRNADSDLDTYAVDDAKAEDDGITFTWLVGRHAYEIAGTCQFSVCLRDIDGNGTVLREFNTTIAELPVLVGIEPIEPLPDEEEYQDLVAQLTESIKAQNDKLIADQVSRFSELTWLQYQVTHNDFMAPLIDSDGNAILDSDGNVILGSWKYKII